MKVIITKYATTSGVSVKTGEMYSTIGFKSDDEMFGHYHGKEWHRDKQSAINDVRTRFEKRRVSLSKALSKLAYKMQSALAEIESAEI